MNAKTVVIYFVALIGWFVYFQFITWFFQKLQGLGYFEFMGSVF